MFLGVMKWRTYFMIALGTGLMLYVISLFAGGTILTFLAQMRYSVDPSAGFIADLVVVPLQFIFSDPVLGAIFGGLFWPILLVWVFLLLVLLVLVALSGGLQSLRESNVLE